MTDKLTLSNVTTFVNDNAAASVVNANSAAIVTAIDNTLSRDGATPNQMGASLDMNSHQILNLPAPTTSTEPVRLQDITSLVTIPPASGTLSSMTSQGVMVATGATSATSTTALTDGQLVVGHTGSAPAPQAVSGDATLSNTGVLTVANNAITNAKAAQMAANTIKGNNTGSTANALDLTKTQLTAMINPVTSSLLGAAPASGGGTSNFLRADATWAVPISTGSAGVVRHFYNGSAWTLVDWAGNPVSTAGTTTSGLQEAINYAQTHGYPLDVFGPATLKASPGNPVAVLSCNDPIVINPIENWNMRVFGCIIDFPTTASAITGSCITIGTLGFCTIDFNCTIQSAAPCAHIIQLVNNGAAYPSSLNYIQNNNIHIRTLVAYGHTPTSCVNIDGVTYAITNNYIRVDSILSGGFASFGLLITNPAASAYSGVVQNIFDCALIVGSTVSEVQIGTSDLTGLGAIGANVFRFGGLTPSMSGMNSGLTTYASVDTYYIGSISINAGSCTQSVLFGTGSTSNYLVAGQADIGNPPVNDSGTLNTYFVGGATAPTVRVKIGVPTSNSGLATGELYANAGVLTRK